MNRTCANPFMGDGWERRDEIKESEREGRHDERGGTEAATGTRLSHILILMCYEDTCMFLEFKDSHVDILMF